MSDELDQETIEQQELLQHATALVARFQETQISYYDVRAQVQIIGKSSKTVRKIWILADDLRLKLINQNAAADQLQHPLQNQYERRIFEHDASQTPYTWDEFLEYFGDRQIALHNWNESFIYC